MRGRRRRATNSSTAVSSMRLCCSKPRIHVVHQAGSLARHVQSAATRNEH